jgi:hypothetical protein
MGAPGCPDFAACTPSIASPRIVFAVNVKFSCVSFVIIQNSFLSPPVAGQQRNLQQFIEKEWRIFA